jgi:hypothetical protein
MEVSLILSTIFAQQTEINYFQWQLDDDDDDDDDISSEWYVLSAPRCYSFPRDSSVTSCVIICRHVRIVANLTS